MKALKFDQVYDYFYGAYVNTFSALLYPQPVRNLIVAYE